MTDIHAMLENWSRWVRVRQVQGHCFSIEHRYLPRFRPDNTPTGWGDWLSTPPLPPLPLIDTQQALAVERVMRHIPAGHRSALRLHYVARLPYRLACKRLHIRYDMWGKFLADAQRMVENRLGLDKSKRSEYKANYYLMTSA